MTYKVVILPFATSDISAGKIYYQKISTALAKQFLQGIREAKNYISENPFSNDVRYRNVRMHLLKQFSYHLHYLVDENKKQIIIIAVEFAKRDNLDFSDRE